MPIQDEDERHLDRGFTLFGSDVEIESTQRPHKDQRGHSNEDRRHSYSPGSQSAEVLTGST